MLRPLVQKLVLALLLTATAAMATASCGKANSEAESGTTQDIGQLHRPDSVGAADSAAPDLSIPYAGDISIVDTGLGEIDLTFPEVKTVEEVSGDTGGAEPDVSIPPGCCATDDDCNDATVCSVEMGPLGVCAPLPGEGACYEPHHCSSTQDCFEGKDCDCGDPFCTPKVGICQFTNGPCCTSNSECPDGAVCVAVGTSKNSCLAEPEGRQCWDDSFCDEGEVCLGASWCGCAFYFCDPAVIGECTSVD